LGVTEVSRMALKKKRQRYVRQLAINKLKLEKSYSKGTGTKKRKAVSGK
jgi:hypothetical protein